jgi:integrase
MAYRPPPRNGAKTRPPAEVGKAGLCLLQKGLQHRRTLLAVRPVKVKRRLSLTPHRSRADRVLRGGLAGVQSQAHRLPIFTGLRNAELASARLQDVDLKRCKISVVRGKDTEIGTALFPARFRGELAEYVRGLEERRVVFLFESNRLRRYSTRRVRQIITPWPRGLRRGSIHTFVVTRSLHS